MLLVGACTAEVDYGDTSYACVESLACPDGLECRNGLCVDATACPEDWWDCSFSRRVPLTFDNSNQNEALTDFPVLIRLDSTRIDYAAAQAGGVDLRFIDSTGNIAAHEIESWDPMGASWIWIRVPLVASGTADTSMSMYYGSADATDAQAPNGVWSTNYVAVYHLNQDPSAQTLDSTSNANHGSSNGDLAANPMPGQIGSALLFDGIDDWVEVADSSSLATITNATTLSAWAYMTDSQAVDAGLACKTDGAGGNYDLQFGIQTEDTPNFRVRTADAQTQLTGGTTLETNRWYWIAGTYDGTQARVFVDSVLDGELAGAGTIIANDLPLVIGRRGLGDDRFFVGAIDELRISNVARSSEWLSAQYLSMTDAFVTYAAEESFP
jgi:hypothetical protein